MVIGIDHIHTYKIKMRHILKDVGPRGLNLNLKALLFLSNQGSHFAPQMLKYIIRPHRTRMWGLGPVLVYDGPALPNQTWQPLPFFLWCGASTM